MNREQLQSQLKFYFSNCNFRKDNFLKKNYEEHNGMPISTLLSFNKLKEEKVTAEMINDLFKDGDFSYLKLEDDKIIKTDMEEYKAYEATDTDALTIYISNLSGDFFTVKSYLEKFFDFSLLRLRKDKSGKLTGSAFVELKKLEDVKRVLAMEIEELEERNEEQPKKVKKETKFLKIISKSEFLEELKKRTEKKVNEKNQRNYRNNARNRLYRLQLLNKKTDMKFIKKITRAAFYDVKENIVRFKNERKEEEIKFRDFILKKLSEKEEKKYFEKNMKK